MSLMPKRGVCFSCGHDHGEPGSFMPPDMERMATAHATEMRGKVERIADLEHENAELRRLAQASLDARDKEARAEMVWDSAGVNYSTEGLKRAARERNQAMVAASKADKALRDALASAPSQPDSEERNG